MSEPLEISDVSDGDLSDYAKSYSQRGAATVELTDLPELVAQTGSLAAHTREELGEFWSAHPLLDDESLDGLGEAQLAAVEKWTREVNETFAARLAELKDVLQAEWWAKEQVLDQLLQASINDPIQLA